MILPLRMAIEAIYLFIYLCYRYLFIYLFIYFLMAWLFNFRLEFQGVLCYKSHRWDELLLPQPSPGAGVQAIWEGLWLGWRFLVIHVCLFSLAVLPRMIAIEILMIDCFLLSWWWRWWWLVLPLCLSICLYLDLCIFC